jgi:hypothetical protein
MARIATEPINVFSEGSAMIEFYIYRLWCTLFCYTYLFVYILLYLTFEEKFRSVRKLLLKVATASYTAEKADPKVVYYLL